MVGVKGPLTTGNPVLWKPLEAGLGTWISTTKPNIYFVLQVLFPSTGKKREERRFASASGRSAICHKLTGKSFFLLLWFLNLGTGWLTVVTDCWFCWWENSKMLGFGEKKDFLREGLASKLFLSKSCRVWVDRRKYCLEIHEVGSFALRVISTLPKLL